MPRTAKKRISYTEVRTVADATSSSVRYLHDPWPSWNTDYTATATATLTFSLPSIACGTGDSIYLATSALTSAVTSLDTWLLQGNPFTIATTAGMWTQWIDADDARIERRAVSEAQRAEWAAQDARRQVEAEARATLARAARETARALLVSCLTPQQRADLASRRCFYVDAPGGRRFRIDEGSHGNVKLLDAKGSIIGSYCVQPDGVPVEDTMLAQKLWLETSPEHLGRIANFSPLRTLSDEDRRLILPSRRAA